MTNKSITRADLTRALGEEVGLSRSDSALVLEEVLGEIVGCLAKGKTVKVHGFAAFTVRHKKKRMGRNPKTGEEVPIFPRKVVVFRPSQKLILRLQRKEF